MKQCTKCKEWKEETEFRKRKDTKKEKTFGICRNCENIHNKQYYKKNKQYFREYKMKNPEKFGIDFYRIKYKGELPSIIVKKIKEQQKNSWQNYYQKNHNTPHYKLLKRKHKRAYFNRHPERTRNRIYADRNLSERFTDEEWQQRVEDTKGICPRCNRLFEEGYGISLDHNPPVSKAPIGFTYTIDNIQPICLSCNCSKKDRIE